MKQRIVLGSALLLMLGTAVAGTFLYGHEGTAVKATHAPSVSFAPDQEVTPELIAAWKATARASEYTPLKAPI